MECLASSWCRAMHYLFAWGHKAIASWLFKTTASLVSLQKPMEASSLCLCLPVFGKWWFLPAPARVTQDLIGAANPITNPKRMTEKPTQTHNPLINTQKKTPQMTPTACHPTKIPNNQAYNPHLNQKPKHNLLNTSASFLPQRQFPAVQSVKLPWYPLELYNLNPKRRGWASQNLYYFDFKAPCALKF